MVELKTSTSFIGGIIIGIVIGLFMASYLYPQPIGDYSVDNIYEEYTLWCNDLLDDWEELYDDNTTWCYDSLDDWAEMYDDLLDDCEDNDYEQDYKTKDFMVIEGIEYDCTYNRYNCIDFPEWADAQTLFIYCKTEGRGDIHYLDGDNDGTACEELNWDYGESNLNFGLFG